MNLVIRAAIAMLLTATSVYGVSSTAGAASPFGGKYDGTVTISTSCYSVGTLCEADVEGEGVGAGIGRSTLFSGRVVGGGFCAPYLGPQTYVLGGSRSNSLTLAYQVSNCQPSGDDTIETGTWTVQGGTGRFAKVVDGRGTYTATYSPLITGTFPFSLTFQGSIVR